MKRYEKLNRLTVQDGRYVKEITFPVRKDLIKDWVYDGLRNVGEIEESIIDGHEMINGITVTECKVKVYALFKAYYNGIPYPELGCLDEPAEVEIWANKSEMNALNKSGVFYDDELFYFADKKEAEISMVFNNMR